MHSSEPTTHTITAINNLIERVVSDGVKTLATAYGFSSSEALTKLREAGLIEMPTEVPTIPYSAPTVVRRSTARSLKTDANSPKIPLPWCGKVVDTWCHALRVNHNLFSQCTNPIEESEGNAQFCKTCWSNYHSRGVHRYGTVEDRISAQKKEGNTVEYTYDNGKDKPKRALPYANVMAKQNPPITQEIAIEEAARFGLTIPEEQFSMRELRRGRPSAKVTITELTSVKERRDIYKMEEELAVEEHISSPLASNAGQKQSDNNAVTDGNNDEEQEEQEEQVEVEEFSHEGTLYYRTTDSKKILYDPVTQAQIGRWDDEQKQIISC